MRPLISIITVSYNAVNSIDETIASVINQNFKNYEYIIIDGLSTDGTCEKIEVYQKHIAYYVSEKDKGIYDAMNKGLSKAKGDFIYYLGADDILTDNNTLSNISKHLNGDSTIFYGDVLFKSRNIIYDGKFNIFKIVTRNISHQSLFYPKKVFCDFKFETDYKVFADYVLNLKLYNHPNYSFRYIDEVVAIFNDEGISGSNTLDYNFQKDFTSIIKQHFPFYIYFYRVIRTKISNFLKK